MVISAGAAPPPASPGVTGFRRPTEPPARWMCRRKPRWLTSSTSSYLTPGSSKHRVLSHGSELGSMRTPPPIVPIAAAADARSSEKSHAAHHSAFPQLSSSSSSSAFRCPVESAGLRVGSPAGGSGGGGGRADSSSRDLGWAAAAARWWGSPPPHALAGGGDAIPGTAPPASTSSSSSNSSAVASGGRMSAPNGEDPRHRAIPGSSSSSSTAEAAAAAAAAALQPWLTGAGAAPSTPPARAAPANPPLPPPLPPPRPDPFMLPTPPGPLFRPSIPPSHSEPSVTLALQRPYPSGHPYYPSHHVSTSQPPGPISMFGFGFSGASSLGADRFVRGMGLDNPYSDFLRITSQYPRPYMVPSRPPDSVSPPVHRTYPLPPDSHRQAKDKDHGRGHVPSPIAGSSKRPSPYPIFKSPESSGSYSHGSATVTSGSGDFRTARPYHPGEGSRPPERGYALPPGGRGPVAADNKQHDVQTTFIPQPSTAAASSSRSSLGDEAVNAASASAAAPSGPHYPPHFMKGSIIQLANGQLKCVEDLHTDDFINSADISPDLKIDSSTVVRIDEQIERGTAILGFSVGEQHIQVTVEATLEHPFFVFGQGWSSCSPERTATRYGLQCQRLAVGDVCISLTHKETLSVLPPTPHASPASHSNGKGGGGGGGGGSGGERPRSSDHGSWNTVVGSGGQQQTSAPTAPSTGAPSGGGRQRRWSAPDLQAPASDISSSSSVGAAPPPQQQRPSPSSPQQPTVKQESESDSDSDVDVDLPATSSSSPQPHT